MLLQAFPPFATCAATAGNAPHNAPHPRGRPRLGIAAGARRPSAAPEAGLARPLDGPQTHAGPRQGFVPLNRPAMETHAAKMRQGQGVRLAAAAAAVLALCSESAHAASTGFVHGLVPAVRPTPTLSARQVSSPPSLPRPPWGKPRVIAPRERQECSAGSWEGGLLLLPRYE